MREGEETGGLSVVVDAPFDAVWPWVSHPSRFVTIYPSWIKEVNNVQRADGETYEGVALNGDRFDIVPKLDREKGLADFEIVNEDGSLETFHAILIPVRREGQNTRTLLTYWWEGFDAPFWEGFRLGTTNADRGRVKQVIERHAAQEERPADIVDYQAMADEQENTARRYPYEVSYDEALEDLEAIEKDGKPHIPTFARRTLERLLEVGLLHTADEPPANVRKVKYVNKEDKEQELWVRFDTRRSLEGYMVVEVLNTPRSDAAILAAMIAWLTQPVDFDQLLEAYRFLSSPEGKVQEEKIEKSMKRMREKAQDFGFEEWKALGKLLHDRKKKIQACKSLQYVMPLLQYYKSEVSSYSPQEQHVLMEKTFGYINDFLESLRKLQAFLEYGAPNRNLLPSIKEPNRDVRAAILHKVNHLSTVEIGERMGIPMHPAIVKKKGENQTVRRMVERGTAILEEAFGEEGWRKRAEDMETEKARWWSLSKEERRKEEDIEMSASQLGISLNEARRRAEHKHP